LESELKATVGGVKRSFKTAGERDKTIAKHKEEQVLVTIEEESIISTDASWNNQDHEVLSLLNRA